MLNKPRAYCAIRENECGEEMKDLNTHIKFEEEND